MLNKNVADLTNFDGKTNKRITQAPGGSSSFSLAWSNEKTDYGPEKQYRKPSRDKNSEYQPRYQPFDYSEPVRVMEEIPNNYGYRNAKNQYAHQNVGGGYGYANYNNVNNNKYTAEQPTLGYGQQQAYGNYGSARHQPLEQLDIAVQQHRISKNQRPPSMPKQQNVGNQGKSSIRINGGPRQNNVFGGNDYNYWKQDNKNEYQRQPGLSQKRIGQQSYQNYAQKNYGNAEKTSVKVHNPPGGKQTFTFG